MLITMKDSQLPSAPGQPLLVFTNTPSLLSSRTCYFLGMEYNLDLSSSVTDEIKLLGSRLFPPLPPLYLFFFLGVSLF